MSCHISLGAFSLGLLTLYPNLLCSLSFLGLDLVADLELERLEADLGVEAGFACQHLEAVFEIDYERHHLEAYFLQPLEAAFYQHFAVDLELQLEAAFQRHLLEVVYLADLDADHLEAALCQAIGPHLEVDF